MTLTEEIHGQRFVAFLDVLGFSDFVDRNDHERLAHVYENFLTGMLPMSLPGMKIKTRNEGTSESYGYPDLSDVQVHALLVSDSILFFSDRANQMGLIHVLLATQRCLNLGFYDGLPLRGAVCVGPLTHQPGSWESGGSAAVQALYGQALVDAKRLESVQQWSGAQIDERALDLFERIADNHDASFEVTRTKNLVDMNLLRRHDIPMKLGGQLVHREGWASNWPWGNRARTSNSMVREAFARHEKDAHAAEQKIQETLRFLDMARPDDTEQRSSLGGAGT